MALTDIQLKMISELIGFLPPEYGEPAAFARSLIGEELHRLAHGPYTLAEAVASGRPFAEIDAPEPTPWIVREGVSLFIAKPNDEPSGSSYWPCVREMCEPVFKLMPEGGEG